MRAPMCPARCSGTLCCGRSQRRCLNPERAGAFRSLRPLLPPSACACIRRPTHGVSARSPADRQKPKLATRSIEKVRLSRDGRGC
ncbi:hypothetical protein NDU88_001071 [Pleurodeles waltl]|uniref:Uncharacterized protein n=1 Tax=Pleurodeles waltl TaxID=8319 RepID=A0AAV7THB1_PLEWA|nr:hypothetical protein NDU88_001071 [Pleurodeles waltl]